MCVDWMMSWMESEPAEDARGEGVRRLGGHRDGRDERILVEDFWDDVLPGSIEVESVENGCLELMKRT